MSVEAVETNYTFEPYIVQVDTIGRWMVTIKAIGATDDILLANAALASEVFREIPFSDSYALTHTHKGAVRKANKMLRRIQKRGIVD